MAGDLLYVREHLSCRHYVSDYRCSFRYREDEAGSYFYFDDEPYNLMIFVLEGELTVTCNEFTNRTFKKGEILFIPKGSIGVSRSSQKSAVITCLFDVINNVCDKLNIHSYWPICRNIDYDFRPLEIIPQLYSFLDSLKYYMQQGINCEHFHELKQRELFLILRWFYKKEELAELLYPIIGNSLDFKALVLENYLKVSSVSELAELSRMGRSHFDAVFKEEFGMPARQWMLKQIAKHVKYHLSEPGVTISDVMIKFNFNSPTHFTRFCKQQFGCTPTELMTKLHSDEIPAN
ncbi:MAG: helix-turn-helix transcriptional regulator [Alistipes sp.]|nr:helix-turn-helix transcriptional regulator [Alistipes sp.]